MEDFGKFYSRLISPSPLLTKYILVKQLACSKSLYQNGSMECQ